ncbi:hypothetical protein ILUMI_01150 [Ignelater luminosus]|uniref:Uncharacterized protein n=1 Tax=Ignelater luminosus TaxID=2038154 RepID=A0A8K0GKJ1_IGNLU|nr:hypothetical protein ILUMI_01150 [Ignelater luminosus]
MKLLLVLSALLAVTLAQRGDFAGRGPIGYPGLAARFRNDDDDNSVSTPSNVGSRFNDNRPTERIPIDARGDADLVNRLNSWPRETRPFWILNAEQIEASRNPQRQNVRPNPPYYQNDDPVDFPVRGGFAEEPFFDPYHH